MSSILAFILIGVLVGEAGALFLERKGLLSIRYVLTAVASSTLVGMIMTLISKGISGFFMVTRGAVLAALIAAIISISLLKLVARPLNKKTDADVPWGAGLEDKKEPEADQEGGDDTDEPADKAAKRSFKKEGYEGADS